MTIRRASEADLETVRVLWHELIDALAEPDWLAETWEEARGDVERHVRDGGVFLAEEDGEAVGFVDSKIERSGLGWIDSLYVRPGARRRGGATALLLEAAARLRAEGATRIGLEVNDLSADARAFYDRLGFAPFSRNVAVTVDELERRARREPVGENFGAVHVRSEDAAAVERGAQTFVPRLGRSAGTLVTEARGGWVSVYDELCDREPRHLRRLARELSDRMGAVVLALGVEQGAVVRYVLFDRGRIADEYASVPEYDGPLPPGDVVALAANPRVAERLAAGDAAALRAAARTASSPAALPPARELAAQVAAAFGLGEVPLGYREAG